MTYIWYADSFLWQASLSQQKAQLDEGEHEHLEDIVTEMRERAEDNTMLLQQNVCKDIPWLWKQFCSHLSLYSLR